MYSVVERRPARSGEAIVHLLPVAIPVLVLFAGGLLVSIAQSTGRFTPVGTPYAGLEAYRALLSQRWFVTSALYSALVAFGSASLSVIAGVVLAYAIWSVEVPKAAVVYKIPLIMPHIAVAFVVILFASSSGIIASWAEAAGLRGSSFPSRSFLFAGNGLGLMLAYTYKEVPFATLLVLGVLMRIDRRLPMTAHNLGASRLRIFTRVLFPFLKPVTATTFIILFLYSFGAFDIPFLLSESQPQMLSIYVYSTYFQRDLSQRPLAAAALVMMLAFSLVLLFAYSRLVRAVGDEVRKL